MSTVDSLQTYVAQVDPSLYTNASLSELTYILDAFANEYYDENSSYTSLSNLSKAFQDLSAGSSSPMSIINCHFPLQSVLSRVESVMQQSETLISTAEDFLYIQPVEGEVEVEEDEDEDEVGDDEEQNEWIERFNNKLASLQERALYLVQTWQLQEAHLNYLWAVVREEGPGYINRFVLGAFLFPETAEIRPGLSRYTM